MGGFLMTNKCVSLPPCLLALWVCTWASWCVDGHEDPIWYPVMLRCMGDRVEGEGDVVGMQRSARCCYGGIECGSENYRREDDIVARVVA